MVTKSFGAGIGTSAPRFPSTKDRSLRPPVERSNRPSSRGNLCRIRFLPKASLPMMLSPFACANQDRSTCTTHLNKTPHFCPIRRRQSPTAGHHAPLRYETRGVATARFEALLSSLSRPQCTKRRLSSSPILRACREPPNSHSFSLNAMSVPPPRSIHGACSLMRCQP